MEAWWTMKTVNVAQEDIRHLLPWSIVQVRAYEIGFWPESAFTDGG